MHLDLRMFRYLHLSKAAYKWAQSKSTKERWYVKILILDNKNTQANIFIYNI